MLRKYFCKQSTLPAKILLIYMIWGLFFIPINAGTLLNNVMVLLVDDNFSLLPFIYCVLILTFLWLPFIYFSNKYLILNEKLILLYGFLYIYLAVVTIWAWMHTERGWDPLILIGGLMFFVENHIPESLQETHMTVFYNLSGNNSDFFRLIRLNIRLAVQYYISRFDQKHPVK